MGGSYREPLIWGNRGDIYSPQRRLSRVYLPRRGATGPLGQPPKVATAHFGPWPHGPPQGGEIRSRGGSVGPPHGPPRVRFWSVLLVNLLVFWNMIACNLITLVLIILHVDVSYDWCFFSEVPRIEELQDSDSSPRRGEVGRRTLGAIGGFLLAFFYRARFQ